MSSDKELMQQALEILEFFWDSGYRNIAVKQKAAADALRERLAQPEQEPLQFKCTIVDDAHPNGVPLIQWGKQPEQEPVIGKWSLREVYFDEDGEPISHRSPPQRTWVGLTESELFKLWVSVPAETEDRFAFARAIEAKLKEKNA